MQERTVSIFALLLTVATGCRSACTHTDSFDTSQYHVSRFVETITDADVILIGNIITVQQIGQPKRSAGDRSLLLQEYTIEISVENIVRGSVPNEKQTYFYFGLAPGAGPAPFRPEVGDRRIVFLRHEGTELRAVRDVFDYTLLVHSGRHNRVVVADKDRLPYIADVLLSPGVAYDQELFASGIEKQRLFIDTITSRSNTLRLLRNLLTVKEPRISAVACLQINAFYVLDRSCLERMIAEPQYLAVEKEAAHKSVLRQSKLEAEVLARLLSDPLSILDAGVPDTRDRIRDELYILSGHPRAAIREASRYQLKRLFPTLSGSNVSSVSGAPLTRP